MFQILQVFLNVGTSASYMSIMFEEKVCQFGHKLGDVISGVQITIHQCYSKFIMYQRLWINFIFKAIKTEPTGASQNDLKI